MISNMKYRHFLSIVCVLLFGVGSVFGQNNTIKIPDVSVEKGKSISLPVNMDNTADVVAVQFTLTVPSGLTLNTATAALSDRSDDHTVTLQSVGSNKYMAMIFSSKNKVIKGRTGKLMSVSLAASNSLAEGTVHQLTLSDVVIGAPDGSNLATGFNAGKVTITKSPDFEVSQVVANETNVNPGGKVNVNWKVSNIGGLPTTGGWSEQILLANEQGTTKLLGTLYNDEILEAGSVVSRNAELNIPAIVGLDGDCNIVVKVVPNSDAGEPSWLRENNVSQTANTVNVKKELSLSPDNVNIDEANAKTIRFQLSRSGNTTSDEVFALTRNEDSRIVLPESITIEKGMSSVYFYAQVVANKVLDNDSIVGFVISGNNYPEASSKIRIEDDTYPSLSISTDAQDVTEGGSISFKVTTQRASKNDVEVKMTCDFSSRFKIPSNIIIPAGQTNVEVNVEAIEDDVPNVEEVVTFTVAAAKHNSASVYTVLVDNDVPTLQLEITPNAVSESAGPLALTAKIRRTDKKDNIVTIKLTDDSEGQIHYANQTIRMGAGVEETTVLLGPIDNALVDGDRTYNISAAVWIASCSCNANNGTSGGVVTVPVTIYDNDGPTLTLSSASSILKEGSEMTVKIMRNTSAEKALVVSLSASTNSDIEYPRTIEIPAGATETTFTVKSKENDISKDSQTVVLTAETDGFSKSSIWFTVSDQTLPDARIASIEITPSRVEVSEEVVVTILLENTGMADLPKGTRVNVYMGNTLSTYSYLQEELKAGETKNIVCKLKPLNYVATCNVYAVVNENREVDELSYTNNSSNVVKLETVSPFTIELQTDKAVYDRGDKISISGVVKGRNVASQQIDVYVINDGYRHVISTTTSEDGTFNVSYEPYSGQMGHFVVGACYPNENSTQELASFDMHGIKRTSSSYIKCEALLGIEYNGSYSVINPGVLPLSGLRATVVSKPDNLDVKVSVPNDVKANGIFNVAYNIVSTTASEGNEWQKVIIRIDSKEGASLTTPLYYYCRKPIGKLETDVTSINTTMVKGHKREYQLILTNVGKGETGKISLDLPEWMHTATPSNIASLSYGNSATIILTFSPTDDMQLNNTISGFIGVNCETGEGLLIPYCIEPVSDINGTLIVDVCDENTYYTSEAPHVAGADVTIMKPTTNSILYQGKTGVDGIYSISLPEGYYKVLVTSENHDSCSATVLVDPEKDKNLLVNLSISAVKVTYTVEETEIEDMYRIKTTTEYETRVPVPAVVVGGPTYIDGDNMKIGESIVVTFALTNKGLIKAQEVCFGIPESTPEWEMKALGETEFAELAPQQSVFVPVMITKLAVSSNSKALRSNSKDTFMSACMAGFSNSYKWNCGKSLKGDKSLYRMALKTCANSAILQALFSNLAFGGIGGGASNGGSNGPGTPNETTTHKEEYKATEETDKVFESPMCDPNYTKCADELLKKLFGMYPVVGKVLNKIDKAADDCIEAAEKGEELSPDYYYNVGKDAYKELKEELNKASKEIKEGASDSFDSPVSADDIKDILESCHEYLESKYEKDKQNAKRAESKYVVDGYIDILDLYRVQLLTADEVLLNFFGDEVWFKELTDDKERFFDYIVSVEGHVDVNSLGDYLPTSVPNEKIEKLLERFNHSSTDAIAWQKIHTNLVAIHSMDDAAIEKGYESLADMCKKAIADKYEELTTSSNSVCSKVQLEFTQNMVMTRQAFRGTLNVYNGSENVDMKDISLTLKISDSMGQLATSDKFQIVMESIEGFDKDVNNENIWELPAQKNGTAKILFIPTKLAAPTKSIPYHFGGTLTYTDPFSGLKVSRELTPVTLTVKPSPNLDLTYFMQRDILGDDPLTEDVEPSEEAEFALLINNTGYGDATDVRMFTEQPEIVDNEKGLLIDFELISSQLNGGEKTLALGGSVATDFGTIPAKSTSYAQWWIKSSLLGHFTNYNVEATHVTSYGNPDLSLLNDTIPIHELIRSLEVNNGTEKLVGFMTNDIVDAEDMPDMLYLSDGEIETVSLINSSELQKLSSEEYLLRVKADKQGWNYGNITDPTYGRLTLKSIIRKSDGAVVPLRNFWQTDRTLRDGKDPLYENKIHFADYLSSTDAEEYLLTFGTAPEIVLEVERIDGVPEMGTVVDKPVEALSVVFNKNIVSESFTSDDIVVTVQGEEKNSDLILISKESDDTFTLDLTQLNAVSGNGYYTLTVNTADITDVDGFMGKNGKMVSWILYDPTGIDEVNTYDANRPVRVYSITGTLMSNGTSKKLGGVLPKGVYIINGRKRVITH